MYLRRSLTPAPSAGLARPGARGTEPCSVASQRLEASKAGLRLWVLRGARRTGEGRRAARAGNSGHASEPNRSRRKRGDHPPQRPVCRLGIRLATVASPPSSHSELYPLRPRPRPRSPPGLRSGLRLHHFDDGKDRGPRARLDVRRRHAVHDRD